MDTKWIQSNPAIMMGKPVITGTRIPVELILEKFAAGKTIEQLLEAYPRLTEEGIRAAFRFAAQALRASDMEGRQHTCGRGAVLRRKLMRLIWSNFTNCTKILHRLWKLSTIAGR